MAANYDDEWWARVYDSIYRATRRREHDFYLQQGSTVAQPVLEIGCGTGMVLPTVNPESETQQRCCAPG